MINLFIKLPNYVQALIATIFTWSVTLLGSAIVFCFKKVNKNLMDAMLGFAAGVMIAASFWSLLSPAIAMASSLNMIPWIITSIGFLSGGIFLFIGDKIFDTMYKKENGKLKRILMLIFSITLHNIPEGLAVGVAFGSILYGLDGATLESASILALGIGLQNFPEGTSVSVPLYREGYSPKKAFFIGQLTGIVEPIAGVIGALLVTKVRILLPFLLAFAAGAMVYVVIVEFVPDLLTNAKKDLMALFTIIGFLIMMILDVALG